MICIVMMMAYIIPLLWGFLLLDIIQRSVDMKNIIKAITLNWVQLIKTVFLAIIVMYVYSLIAFTFFP